MVELLVVAIVTILTYPFYMIGKTLQTIIMLPAMIIAVLKGQEIKLR